MGRTAQSQNSLNLTYTHTHTHTNRWTDTGAQADRLAEPQEPLPAGLWAESVENGRNVHTGTNRFALANDKAAPASWLD